MKWHAKTLFWSTKLGDDAGGHGVAAGGIVTPGAAAYWVAGKIGWWANYKRAKLSPLHSIYVIWYA